MHSRSAVEIYADSMGLICQRFHLIDSLEAGLPLLTEAETIALQVRKIVEGIAFAALSGTEHRNKSKLLNLRSKDGADIIRYLEKRQLLQLPLAQEIRKSDDPAYSLILSGRGELDLTADDLTSAFKLASQVIHERHPERLSLGQVTRERDRLREIAISLRRWLWTHMTTHRGEAIVVQMGLYPTEGWCGGASKIAPLPEESLETSVEDRKE